MGGHHSAIFESALVYAYQLHGDQTRKGGSIPYMSHLMAVCGLAQEHGADEDTAIAALLHDAVEDRGGQETARAIEARFGARVRAIVEGCSDTDVVPKPPWRARKEAYIAHARTASPEVLLVSCCDKLHNARTLRTDLRSHGMAYMKAFNATLDDTLWYLRSLAAIFRERACPPALVDELDSVLADLTAWNTAHRTDPSAG